MKKAELWHFYTLISNSIKFFVSIHDISDFPPADADCYLIMQYQFSLDLRKDRCHDAGDPKKDQ